MKYKLLLTKKAKDDLFVLEKKEQKRIVEKLRFYLSSDKPLTYAKKLKDIRLGTYRFRIGDYRAIFDIDKQGNITILLILRIKHRKDVYL
ncbi:type II toxin-antitoxin system RelE/ParE family toxin [Patescibacteria group bacterium]|nr:type II toxin-antitoxin system RelE/ParE family toxin [Patescibacteria group bacterium]